MYGLGLGFSLRLGVRCSSGLVLFFNPYRLVPKPEDVQAKLATAKKAEARKKVAKVEVQGLRRGATDESRRFLQAFVQPRQPVVPLDHLPAHSASPFTASEDHDDGPNDDDGPNNDDDEGSNVLILIKNLLIYKNNIYTYIFDSCHRGT